MVNFGIVLAMAGSILAFWPLSAEPFTLPKIVAILAGALVAHLGLAWQGGGNRWANTGRFSTLCLLWGAALAVATVNSSDISLSLIGGRSSMGGPVLHWFALALAVSAVVRSNVSRKQLLRWASYAGGVCGFAAMLQGLNIWLLYPEMANLYNGRASSFMGGPVPLGAVLAATIAAPLWLALENEEGSVTHAACFVAIAAGLAASGTRGAMGGAALSVLLVLFVRGILSSWMTSMLIAMAGIGAIASRAHALASDAGRLEVWRIALKAIQDRPLLGWGPDTFEMVMRRYISDSFVAVHGGLVVHPGAHNLVLQILFCTGVVGLALAAAALWTLRDIPLESEDVPALASLGAVICCSLVNPVPTTALCLVGILAAPALRRGEEPADRRTPLALAGASALALALCVKLVAADSHALLGYRAYVSGDGDNAALQFAKASELNPFSAAHNARQLDMLRLAAINSRSAEDARSSALAGLAVAEQNVRLHPEDPMAWEALASQYALMATLADEGDRRVIVLRAISAMEKSVALAPTFDPGLKRLAALRRWI